MISIFFIIVFNELHFKDGNLWINLFAKNDVIVVDTSSWKVLKTYDMSKQTELANRIKMKRFGKKLKLHDEVLNGITWNHDKEYFLLTGKNWPVIFGIKFEDFSKNHKDIDQ